MKKGFSLVEVIVAMTLLSVGMLAIAGTAFMAARMQTQAQLQERMAASARSVLDSVVAYRLQGAGKASFPRYEVAWTASQSEVAVDARMPNAPPVQLRAIR